MALKWWRHRVRFCTSFPQSQVCLPQHTLVRMQFTLILGVFHLLILLKLVKIWSKKTSKTTAWKNAFHYFEKRRRGSHAETASVFGHADVTQLRLKVCTDEGSYAAVETVKSSLEFSDSSNWRCCRVNGDCNVNTSLCGCHIQYGRHVRIEWTSLIQVRCPKGCVFQRKLQ